MANGERLLLQRMYLGLGVFTNGQWEKMQILGPFFHNILGPRPKSSWLGPMAGPDNRKVRYHTYMKGKMKNVTREGQTQ